VCDYKGCAYAACSFAVVDEHERHCVYAPALDKRIGCRGKESYGFCECGFGGACRCCTG
jgi:hypothetical protein